MTQTLGIDFGGTKILAGVIDRETGAVVSKAKKRTRAEHGVDDIMSRLLEISNEALSAAAVVRNEIQYIGIGVAGQVDPGGQSLLRAPNLPDELLGTAIVRSVEKSLNLPTVLFNDVEAAAAGEAAFGAGTSHDDFVCVFVGTGIGGAIYQQGKPYKGATNTAGELGHMVVDYDGRFCGCGGKGHLEAYASRTAIVRSILAAMRQGRETSLRKVDPAPNPDDPAHSPIRSRALAEAVAGGDALAIEMIEDAARYMAGGLASIINFYNPKRIILGGGVVAAVDLYFDEAVAHATQEALLVPRQHVEIVKAQLGDYSGIVGAAVLAQRR